jgi:hypothetical protein
VTDVEPPWRRARKQRHRRQEERLARTTGGQQGIASGRLWRFKRDGKLYGFLIEARDTQTSGYRIEYDEFKRITTDAYRTPPGLLPAMQIDIKDLQLMTIRLTDFQSLMTRLRNAEARLGIDAPIEPGEYEKPS